MKKVILFAAVAVAMLSLAALQPVQAACGSPRSFTTSNGAEYSYLYTPGYPHANGQSVSDNFDGVFWSFGGGVPGATGNDSGSFGPRVPTGTAGQYYAWLYPGGTFGTLFYPAMIYNAGGYSNWADARVDGCIDLDGSDPALVDPDQCMVVLLTDEVGGVGYFALIAQGANPSGDYFLNEAAGSSAITLAPIPKPSITGSTAVGNNVQLNMSVAAPTGGLYLNCSPAQNSAALQAFNLQVETTARGIAPTGTTVAAPGGSGTPGGGATIDVTCSDTQDTDVYVCTTLGFDSNYETSVCSENATTVQCGPTLGDPLEIRPQPREFKHRPAGRTRPAADRGRSGR